MAMTEDGGASVPNPLPTGRERVPPAATRHLVESVARTCTVTAVTFAFYALAPLDRRPEGAVAVEFAVWLVAFAAVLAFQTHAVIRSHYPGVRAVEAVAVSVPLLIVLFASTYFVTGQANPGSFTEPLTRIDALYFTVTVFATVGFGDISPRTDLARMLVTAQMLADLVLVGFIANVLIGAVQHRRRTLAVSPTRRSRG
jgi:voltage-gated potassium channel